MFAALVFFAIVGFVTLIGRVALNDAKVEESALEKKLGEDLLIKSLPNTTGGSTQQKVSASSNQANTQNQISITQKQENTASLSEAASDDNTKNPSEAEKKPLIFSNKDISFDYPEEFKTEESNGQILISKNESVIRLKIYSNKEKNELKAWFDDYFSEKNNVNCTEADSGVLKLGTLATKRIEADTETGECEDGAYFTLNDSKSKVVRVKLEKITEEEANDILVSFEFIK